MSEQAKDIVELLMRRGLLARCERLHKKPSPGGKKLVKFPRKLAAPVPSESRVRPAGLAVVAAIDWLSGSPLFSHRSIFFMLHPLLSDILRGGILCLDIRSSSFPLAGRLRCARSGWCSAGVPVPACTLLDQGVRVLRSCCTVVHHHVVLDASSRCCGNKLDSYRPNLLGPSKHPE